MRIRGEREHDHATRDLDRLESQQPRMEGLVELRGQPQVGEHTGYTGGRRPFRDDSHVGAANQRHHRSQEQSIPAAIGSEQDAVNVVSNVPQDGAPQ